MINFEELLREFGPLIGLDSLVPNEYHACSIRLNDFPDLSFQIQMDRVSSQVLIVGEIIDVPPGIYKQQVFRAALFSNSELYPRIGTLSYSDKNSTLVLHDFIPLEHLDGNKLYNYILAFSIKCNEWKQSVETGQLPDTPEDTEGNAPLPSSPFDIK